MNQNHYKLAAVFVLVFSLSLVFGVKVNAADSNFADGITVDSVLDTPDATIGDTFCDDGAGNCTLRAAIAEANYTAGVNTINFSISGSGVKTIQPTSALPNIDDQVVINGYSQPGSQANTATSPLPFNGTLLIEIDGTNAGSSNGMALNNGASGSTISGLVINRFAQSGIALQNSNISDISISGNYIGTSADGATAQGNAQYGLNAYSNSLTDIMVGGTSAASRNIISANGYGGIQTGSNSTGSVSVQGNYIGLAADGHTDIGRGQGVVVSIEVELIDNVISGNPDLNVALSSPRGRVVRNLIGTNYLAQIDSGVEQGIGLTINQSAADLIIGGPSPADANTIAGNSAGGVIVSEISLPFPLLLTPSKITIIGNRIFGNINGPYVGIGSAPGLGIDLLRAELDGSFVPQSGVNIGPTLNDPLDSDVGPNNYINFPVLNSITEANNGGTATINYSLDAADSPTDQYRVEFFGNTEADPSGYGEGQTFLGAITSSNGNNQQTSLTLPSGYSLQGKYVSATTTAIDSTTTSGFGATSEFSKVVQIPASTSISSLAGTGQSSTVYALVALSVLSLATGTIVLNRRSNN